jgi:hypothetical protein
MMWVDTYQSILLPEPATDQEIGSDQHELDAK